MCLSNCICQNDHYHDCIVHDYILCGKFLNERTDGRTDKAILGVGFRSARLISLSPTGHGWELCSELCPHMKLVTDLHRLLICI